MNNPEEIDIKVNVLDGNPIHITISDHATVLELMVKIMEKTGIHENEQRLIYLGRSLEKDKKLSDYSIHKGVCVQLVRQPIAQDNYSVDPDNENVETIQTSYVVYLPFRITETTTIPVDSDRPHASSVSSINGHESEGHQPPLEGAPPVPRYPDASIVSTQNERVSSEWNHLSNPIANLTNRLQDAVQNLRQQGVVLSNLSEPLELRTPAFHSTLHSFEKVVNALCDYYHTYQNENGVAESVGNPSLVLNAIKTIQTVSQTIQSHLHCT